MSDSMTPKEIRALMTRANSGDATALARFAEHMREVKAAFDLVDKLPAKERMAAAKEQSSKARTKGG